MKPNLIVKPFPRPNIKPKRLLEGKLMTIAAGFHSREGVLIFADTNVVLSDGSRQSGRKLEHRQAKDGFFGIANATEDGNAAKTLTVAILDELEQKAFNTFKEIEASIINQMTVWAYAYNSKAPGVQLVLAAVWKQQPRLYFCEPPNTIVLKEFYASAGTGARVTDPLVNILIGDNPDIPVRKRLWQIAYLAYRAKKDDALCDGLTHVMFFPSDGGTPYSLSATEMKSAENLGPTLDMYMRQIFSNAITAKNHIELKDFQDTLYQIMTMNSNLIAKQAFPPLIMPWDLVDK